MFDAARHRRRLQPGLLRETFVDRLYRTTDGTWKTLPADGSRPADMATTTMVDGRTVDFVVRRERGTINRFIYSRCSRRSATGTRCGTGG